MIRLIASLVISAAISLGGEFANADDSPSDSQLTMIIMDPLAGPLSCPCVEGYAQRKYEVLGAHLEEKVGRKVNILFAESLSMGLKKSNGKCDIIIGKDSVVRAESTASGKPVVAVARLTDQNGSTEQFGMIVVNRDDPAQELKDLADYNIIFGPSEAAEKHDAAIELLTSAGVSIPKTLTIDIACSDGACKVIDLGPKSKTAAVISSYAQPLLEGCGTIKKGDLRVVGKTDPVPFITVFLSKSLSNEDRSELVSAMCGLEKEPKVLEALESLIGFVTIDEINKTAKKK